MVLAAFLFIRRMAAVTNVSVVTHDSRRRGRIDRRTERSCWPSRHTARGSRCTRSTVRSSSAPPQTFKDDDRADRQQAQGIDRAHASRLPRWTERHAPLPRSSFGAAREGTAVILSDVHMQPLVALTDTPALREIGAENVAWAASTWRSPVHGRSWQPPPTDRGARFGLRGARRNLTADSRVSENGVTHALSARPLSLGSRSLRPAWPCLPPLRGCRMSPRRTPKFRWRTTRSSPCGAPTSRATASSSCRRSCSATAARCDGVRVDESRQRLLLRERQRHLLR